MAKYHNKKRNIGIIYEQLINYTSKKMVSNEKEKVELAVSIIREHFKKDTQLYKEYKLFKALASTNNISDNLATSIIEKAKVASNKMFNDKQLQKEKSSLIKLLTEFEIKLHNLLTEKREESQKEVIKENRKLSNLEFNIMNNIYKEKYEKNLTEIQNKILSSYLKDDKESLRESFTKLKIDTLSLLEKYGTSTDNMLIKQKYKTIKESISILEEENFNKENIHKYLTLSKLYNELLGD